MEMDRFYPSSKTCSSCGFVTSKEKLMLATRHWTCPNCHTNHDRDVNASLNILKTVMLLMYSPPHAQLRNKR